MHVYGQFLCFYLCTYATPEVGLTAHIGLYLFDISKISPSSGLNSNVWLPNQSTSSKIINPSLWERDFHVPLIL